MDPRYSETNPEHLKAALKHAEILQQQKAVDRQNFDALERLLDCPWSANASVETPAADDMLEVNKLLQLFRPVDFDELANERRLANVCGYVLCTREAPVKAPVKHGGANNRFGRVPRARTRLTSGLWCSPECLQRAAYIRAQLLEEPGWLRPTADVIPFRFPVGTVDLSQTATTMRSTTADDMGGSGPRLGDTPRASQVSTGSTRQPSDRKPSLLKGVVERRTAEPFAPLAGVDGQEAIHNAIEGHVI